MEMKEGHRTLGLAIQFCQSFYDCLLCSSSSLSSLHIPLPLSPFLKIKSHTNPRLHV